MRSSVLVRGSRLRSSLGDGFGAYRRVFRSRETIGLIGAGVVSEIGDWFNTVALIALSFDYGNGALGVGGMLALRLVPRLILQVPAGVLVDHWPGRRVLVVSHLLMGAVATAFTLLLAVPELWLLYLLVLALEAGNAVAWPAFRVQLARETAPGEFAAVNGLLSILMTGAQFLGPLLGGLVLVAFGAGPVFVINGLSFLAVALVAARLGRRSPAAGDDPAARDGQISMAAVERAPDAVPPHGYGWLVRRVDLMLFSGAALGVTLVVRGAIALFVVSSEILDLGEGGPGYFYAAVAFGAVLGGVVAGAGQHAERSALRNASLAMIVCVLALIGFGAADSTLVALLALALAGLATNVYEVLGLTYFQHQLPASHYGRFMAIFMLALGVGGITGALLGPLIETELSVVASLGLIAAPGLILAAVLLLREGLAR